MDEPITVTPRQIADVLRESGMAEDDVLDMLKRIGDKSGWTKQLNLAGAYYLKPHAQTDEEAKIA